VWYVGNSALSENGLPAFLSSTSSLIVTSCPACGVALSGAGGSARVEMPGAIVLNDALPQNIAAALLLVSALSPREKAAFELLGLGYGNRSIARELQISERTTKRHVTAILRKLQLESRLQAGLAAVILSSSSSRPGE
jgi:DNA-binding NarL/FixJ family response regulator